MRIFAICIGRTLDDREVLKVYRVLDDPEPARSGLLRTVDDSGEDYLDPVGSFLSLRLDEPAAEALEAMLPAVG